MATNQYHTIPVDNETYRRILEICQVREMGQRAQGALIRQLVKSEYQKLQIDQETISKNLISKQ
jgi:hypothetical protein